MKVKAQETITIKSKGKIKSVSLDPQVDIIKSNLSMELKGHILLEVQIDSNTEEKQIPLSVTIPYARIKENEMVFLSISEFDYSVDGNVLTTDFEVNIAGVQ